MTVKIRVHYKSGATEEFWASEFNIRNYSVRGYSWTAVEGPDGVFARPLLIGADEIESVWQIGREHSKEESAT